MESIGLSFTLEPVEKILASKYVKSYKTLSNKELLQEDRILNSSFADKSLIKDLLDSKFYLHDNISAYSKYRDKIIPKNHKFLGNHYKYHTYIKLIQTFILCGIDKKNIKSFYDICGAPGEWARSLLKECPINQGYAISLVEGDIPYDKEILTNKKLTIISPKDGNIYKIKNLKESISKIGRVDLVCCDGGFCLKSFNIKESLQSLAHLHLIFAEFIYGLYFTKIEKGIFICKVFDLLDDITVQLLMCATLFYNYVKIVKPKESRMLNGEKYLVCQGLEYNDENNKLKNKLINLLVKCQNSNPGEIFKKKFMKDKYIKNFKESLININNVLMKKQSNEIYRVVNLCKKKMEKEFKNK